MWNLGELLAKANKVGLKIFAIACSGSHRYCA